MVSLFRAWRDEDDSCRAHNAGVSLVATRLARFVMAIWDRESWGMRDLVWKVNRERQEWPHDHDFTTDFCLCRFNVTASSFAFGVYGSFSSFYFHRLLVHCLKQMHQKYFLEAIQGQMKFHVLNLSNTPLFSAYSRFNSRWLRNNFIKTPKIIQDKNRIAFIRIVSPLYL